MNISGWKNRYHICGIITESFRIITERNHLNKTIKILGYLKKFPKKGYVIDPKPCNVNIKYDDMVPDFGNQYDESNEEIDENIPEPKMR